MRHTIRASLPANLLAVHRPTLPSNSCMKYTRILPLITAILVPFIATADPVVDDFATIPNLGATLDCKGGMLLASDGNYYGVAGGNGSADKGSIFKMTPVGVATTLVAFTGNGGAVPGN